MIPLSRFRVGVTVSAWSRARARLAYRSFSVKPDPQMTGSTEGLRRGGPRLSVTGRLPSFVMWPARTRPALPRTRRRQADVTGDRLALAKCSMCPSFRTSTMKDPTLGWSSSSASNHRIWHERRGARRGSPRGCGSGPVIKGSRCDSLTALRPRALARHRLQVAAGERPETIGKSEKGPGSSNAPPGAEYDELRPRGERKELSATNREPAY